MARTKGGHPLTKLAVARARPISKQTLSAMGWPAEATRAKKTKARPQKGGTAAICQKSQAVVQTRLITRQDLETERAASEVRARERKEWAKTTLAAGERAFKKRLRMAPAAGKQKQKRLVRS